MTVPSRRHLITRCCCSRASVAIGERRLGLPKFEFEPIAPSGADGLAAHSCQSLKAALNNQR